MADDTVTAVCNLLKRRAPELKSLQIEWFGGEPLLAYEIVARVSKLSQMLADSNAGLRYVGKMTTNASMLTSTRLHELVSAGVVQYQITLDGPPDVHNLRRVGIRDQSTYSRVWSALKLIQASRCSVEVLVRLHVDKSSVDQFKDVVPTLKRELFHDERFKPVVHSLDRLGGARDEEILPLHPNEVAELQGLFGPEEPVRRPRACYAAMPNSFVIRSNGSVSKCTVALRDHRNIVGTLTAEGGLSIDTSRVMPWMRGINSREQSELDCPLINLPMMPSSAQSSRVRLRRIQRTKKDFVS